MRTCYEIFRKTPMRPTFAAVVFLVFGSVIVPGLAHAQANAASAPTENDLRARRYFEAGSTRYDDGDYEGAADDFRRAYELSHRTGLLFNLYLAEERRGHLDVAADYLDRYLAANPTLEGREQMLVRLQNLRERIGREHEASAPSATSSEAPSDAPASGGIPTASWIAWGTAAAGVATFAVFGAMALSENSRLRDSCGSSAGRTCTDDDVGPLRRDDLIADIGLGVAIAGTVAGFVILWVSGDEDSSDPAPVAVAPWVTLHGGGAVVRMPL